MAKKISVGDPAHKETDKIVAKLERKLRHTYSKAYGDAAEKFMNYMAAFERKDMAHKGDVAAGRLTEEEYTNWRRNQLLYADTLAGIRDTIAEDLQHVNKMAIEMVRDEQVDVYALNHNYSTYEVEHGLGIDTSFTLYDHDTVERLMKEDPDLLPRPSAKRQAEIDAKGIAWNKQKLTSNFTASILAGDSIPKMAERISSVAAMSQAAAIRNARTMCTGAENAGRQRSYERAQNMGVKLRKTWNSLRDGHVRDSHIEADGQTVGINEAFSLTHGELMYPGDPGGPPAETYNCRCFQTTQLDGFDFSKASDEVTEAPEYSDMDFDDWVSYHEKKSNDAKKELAQDKAKADNRNREILEQKIKNGEITLELNHDMQKKHIGVQEDGRSYFDTTEDDIQEIVKKKHGTGRIMISKSGQIKEVIDTERDISRYRELGDKEKGIPPQHSTNMLVHYSETRTHAVPARPNKKKKEKGKNDGTK